MMTKENQRVVITKRLIKEGLLRLLEKKHISKISISELCQEAGVNRTTFYRHYVSPKDVLEEIAFDQIAVFSQFSTPVRGPQDMKEFITRMCAFLYDSKEMVKIFIQNDTEVDFTRIFQTLSKQFLGTRKVLYKGKTVDSDTLDLFNAFFSSGMYALISRWLTENIPKTSVEIADLICCSLSTDFTFQ